MPLAGLEGLGEDVGSLQLSIDVHETAIGLVHDLLNAANVDLVSALDVTHFVGETSPGHGDGGLVILADFQLKRCTFDGVKHGQHG